jgi:hypothetical protein
MGMTKHTTPRCHFATCKAPVTHTVQRLWTIPGRAPFALQYCCDAHIPGSFDRDSLFMQRLRAHGRGLSPFYRVERIIHAA